MLSMTGYKASGAMHGVLCFKLQASEQLLRVQRQRLS